jgi:hypothetical protein
VRLGVCASAGILRWLGKENERKPDPSHKPFTPPPGFCAELIRRKRSFGRVFRVLGWVSVFSGHHVATLRRGGRTVTIHAAFALRACVSPQMYQCEEGVARRNTVPPPNE